MDNNVKNHRMWPILIGAALIFLPSIAYAHGDGWGQAILYAIPYEAGIIITECLCITVFLKQALLKSLLLSGVANIVSWILFYLAWVFILLFSVVIPVIPGKGNDLVFGVSHIIILFITIFLEGSIIARLGNMLPNAKFWRVIIFMNVFTYSINYTLRHYIS